MTLLDVAQLLAKHAFHLNLKGKEYLNEISRLDLE